MIPTRSRDIWLIALPLLAWAGNALYALGDPGGQIKAYSPALVAAAMIAYVVLHGRRRYGGNRLLRLALIVFVVGWLFESLSVVSGFPFGNYHYTEVMAPYIGNVPVFVLPAYLLMGYASWSLATVLVGALGSRLSSADLVTVPLIAAMAMVAWDLSMDPLRATLEGRWVWHGGGAYMGIPVSNYFGWFGVTWLMFLAFALYLRRSAPQNQPTEASMAFWVSIPMIYLSFAVEYLLNPLVRADPRIIVVNGRDVPVNVFHADVATVCLVTMVPLAIAGAVAAIRRPVQQRERAGDALHRRRG